MKPNLRRLIRFIDENKTNHKTLLDVGCGKGDIIKSQDYKYNTTGIDIDIAKINRLRAWGCNAKHCDIREGIPFNNNEFDIVTITEVLEHLIDTEFIMREIYRVLRPGGLLGVTVPNAAGLHCKYRLVFKNKPSAVSYKKEENDHIRAYCRPHLEKQLKENNFEIIKMDSVLLPYCLGGQLVCLSRSKKTRRRVKDEYR